jgi:predicted transcriptional regulator
VSEDTLQALKMSEYKHQALLAAIEEAEKGIFISEEAIDRWVESWGTENELPPPEPDIFRGPKVSVDSK